MKRSAFLLGGLILFFSSCEIVQETKFNEDGSGVHSVGIDMSEVMRMGMGSKLSEKSEEIKP